MTPARKHRIPLQVLSRAWTLHKLSGWKIFATQKLQGLTPPSIRQKLWRAAHMSPSPLGNLSKPGELLHYLQPPFFITLYLQGTLNTQQWRLQSVQPNLSLESVCGLPIQGLGTPLLSLSINFRNPHGPPPPACGGYSSPECRSLLFLLRLGSELSWESETRAVQATALSKHYPKQKARTRGA